MSHKSKSTAVTMAVSLIAVVAYVIYAVDKNAEGSASLQSWAVRMLVFIGITVVAIIAIQILFHIALATGIAATEARGDSKLAGRILSSAMAEDEMDNLIRLKTIRVGQTLTGVGFVAALVALALGGSDVLALHILLGSFAAASLVAGAIGIYGYERGIRHG